MSAPVRISVVVPAYKAEKTIERLVASLDAQTLPQEQFETIIVDDGSPDATYATVRGLLGTRPNLRVHSITASGWASRPRNVGTAMARGTYVIYLDADDTLYADGLRRCVEYADEHGSDVLSPKESKTNAPWWAMDRFAENIPNLVGAGGIEGLLPMMPHKVYRREFLLEHGITFPEGANGERVLWEDIWFNMEAFRHARVVSVLSDTPVYRWHATAGSISRSYGPRTAEYWRQVERLLVYIQTLFAGDEHRASRESMLLHQYRDRVLLRLSRMAGSATASEVRLAMEQAMRLQAEHITLDMEQRLGKLERARGELLRAGRADLLAELWAHDRLIRNSTTASSVAYEHGTLTVRMNTTWWQTTGERVPFERDGDRVIRDLPASLLAVLSPDVVDVTDELTSVGSAIWVRSRAERVTWAVPATSSATFVPTEYGLALSVQSVATVDVDHAGAGRSLDEPVWDLWSETRWLGAAHRCAVKWAGRSAASMASGRVMSAYANKKGELSVDLAQRLRTVVRDGGGRLGALERRGTGFRIQLPSVDVVGRTVLDGQVAFERTGRAAGLVRRSGRLAGLVTRLLQVPASAPAPCRVTADPEGGAWLESTGTPGAGRWELVMTVAGPPVKTGVFVSVTDDGRLVERPAHAGVVSTPKATRSTAPATQPIMLPVMH